MKDNKLKNKHQPMTLSDIFDQTDVRRENLYEIVNGWNFKDIDSFIISFERLNQNENISFSRKFGNISKQITREILEEDCGSFDLDNSVKFSDDYILKFVRNKKPLHENFKKLYDEIFKRNQWKLESPLVSLKYDLLLDRYNNDYERFKAIHPFLHENKTITSKEIKSGNKTELKSESLNEKEINEIEKIYYLLINKINRKRDGESFLKKYNVFSSSSFE